MAAPSPLQLALVLLALALALSTSSSAAAAPAPARQCAYTLRVKTSCASPARTSDAVSVAFGDAYRNEAQAARLPTSGAGGSRAALERCGTDTFRVRGPCGYGVCYLYLRRSGSVGWTPEWVRVYEPSSSTPSTFYFGDPLANGVWYGTDRCPKPKAAQADGDHEHAAVASATNSSASTRG
ncbi:unnamed protein product [Urochloa decumbens]|uniref:Uncharacterized protein n=1 Tax=Urochloa decumbens TaxID=240449 RepID=A0ABC8WIK1_9POAL